MLALVLPLIVLHRTYLHPATNLVAARADADPYDDPTTNATSMARAWARFDRGDFRPLDDRVFAPTPNAIALGEYYPLPCLLGYPFARLFHSVPLGHNVPYYLALVAVPVVLYALYAQIAGPGLGAALAAFLVAWGPGRMNTLGAINILTTAFTVLALLGAIRYFRFGRRRNLVLFAASLAVQAFSSLYGVVQGGIWAAGAFVILGGRGLIQRGSLRRLFALALASVAALTPVVLYSLPYFRSFEELGVFTDRNTFEAHAADLLSLLHGGIFGGPVSGFLEHHVIGFTPGAAAFFPTLSIVAVLAAWAVFRRRFPVAAPVGIDPLASPVPWVFLAGFLFVLALGPTVRLAGRPVASGLYLLVMKLPVIGMVRGIHRFDQWFDFSLGAAAVLAFAKLRQRFPGRALPALACGLVLLDTWPADIPSYRFPSPTSAAEAFRSLPPDAIVAYLPWSRYSATRAFVDQVDHGRRVANGSLTFITPLHLWLGKALGGRPDTSLALLRDLGVSAVAVDRAAVSPEVFAGFEALTAPNPILRIQTVEQRGEMRIFRLGAEPARRLGSGDLSGLVFHGRHAHIGPSSGALVFFIGPQWREVDVVLGRAGFRDRLYAPPALPPPYRVSLGKPAPPGSRIVDVRTGRLLGVGE